MEENMRRPLICGVFLNRDSRGVACFVGNHLARMSNSA